MSNLTAFFIQALWRARDLKARLIYWSILIALLSGITHIFFIFYIHDGKTCPPSYIPSSIPKYLGLFTALPSNSWFCSYWSLTFIHFKNPPLAQPRNRSMTDHLLSVCQWLCLRMGDLSQHQGAVIALHTSWCSTWNASKVAVQFTLGMVGMGLSRSPGKNGYGDCASCSPLALVFGSLGNWAGGMECPCCVFLVFDQETVNFSF